jgi:Asp-tRNA(Asn)/Glu-tRNA(Gln) amidotransferase A subunit family amidase
MLSHLESAGHPLQEVSFDAEDVAADMWQIWCSRIFESFLPWPAEKRRLLGPGLQQACEAGAAQTSAQLAGSRLRLRELATRMANAFDDIDLLLTPTTPTTAPPVGRLFQDGCESIDWFGLGGYTYPFNVTQQPALSLPLGTDAQGLPFGLQIAGRKYHDADVMSFGTTVESMLGARG